MEQATFSEKQERLLQCINPKKQVYALLCDEQAADDGQGGTQYRYQYVTFPFMPPLAMIKDTVCGCIDARTRERIVSTLTWNQKPVWLSTENQQNWKAAYDRALQTDGANLPLKLKIGEQDDGTPVYHTFTSVNAFGDFWDTCQQHIHQCLADGWAMKDGMDWSEYEI